MKKSILLLIILINYSNLFSQVENAFVIENSQGSALADNEILEFSSVEYDDASYNFYVRNLTSDEILLKAEVVSYTGTDGSGMEFCFGECYFGVIEGYSYPLAASVSVQPGQTQTSNGDHFFNQDPGDGSTPVEYTFRFYMVDQNGDEVVSQAELQTDFSINYYYSASLGLNNLDGSKIIYFTLNNKLIINSQLNLSLKIYDLSGRIISENSIMSGHNSIDLMNLSEKHVILTFESEGSQIISKKILIP